MPSSSKKRKAAKKKKEQQAVNNNSHGNVDMKSQGERDSDGTDVGSPASQADHNHQHPFNHREEERKRGPSPVESHVTEEKSVDEITRDAKSTGKSGLDDVEGAAHVRIQHVELDKRSICSSSSDDESRASEKKSKEEAYSEETSYGNKDKLATVMSMKVAENGTHGDANGNSAVEVAAVENSVKTVTEEVGNGTEVESRSKESEAELLPPSNGTSGVELEGNEGKVSTSLSMPPAETSNVVEKTRDAESHDYSKKQPRVASTPLTVQRTSLFSCCGLVDVLTGSNR